MPAMEAGRAPARGGIPYMARHASLFIVPCGRGAYSMMPAAEACRGQRRGVLPRVCAQRVRCACGRQRVRRRVKAVRAQKSAAQRRRVRCCPHMIAPVRRVAAPKFYESLLPLPYRLQHAAMSHPAHQQKKRQVVARRVQAGMSAPSFRCPRTAEAAGRRQAEACS